MPERVAITGLGTVNAFGSGAKALADALQSGVPRLSSIDRGRGYHVAGSARQALLVAPDATAPWVKPAAARRMCASSRFAVAAALQACEDAGISIPRADASLGVYLSTSFGAVVFADEMVREILFKGPEAASPFLFTETVANAPAAQVAIATGARGPNVTVTQREAGALLAVGLAAADVARGRVRVALAGAVEEGGALVHAMLDRFRALARPTNGGGEVARPFDLRRDGFLMAAGATLLVLERKDEASRRGARILAEVVASASAFDPTASSVSWGVGHDRLCAALRRVLDRARLEVSRIDRIVSGASGSIAGDRLEAQVLRALWRDRPLPPILTPKSVVGEYAGTFLAAALLAAQGLELPATQGLREMDPACGIEPRAGAPPEPPRSILLSSLAAGGSAAWLVLSSTPAG